MIITFSRQFAVNGNVNSADTRYATALDALVLGVVDNIAQLNYPLTWKNDSPTGNIYAVITWARGNRVRFTLETRDAWKHGSRTSASGRHMRKASWEAHRDVLKALFELDPEATIRTALATYRGKADFEHQFPATAHKNVGSIMEPRTFRSTSITEN